MQSRYWYALDQLVNPMGMGCWQLAGEHYINGIPNGWGHIDDKQAISLIHHALNQGIQLFDTAAGYGNGKSEELLGKAFAQSPLANNAIICTKIPLTQNEIDNLSFDHLFTQKVEDALKRLHTNTIHILLIHNPPDNLNWKSFDTHILDTLLKSGKICSYGVSSTSIAGAENVLDAQFGSCIEWVFNILERRPIDKLFPKLENAKCNFIARSPLSRGLIAHQYLTNNPNFNNTDFRSTLPQDWISWVLKSIRNIGLIEPEAQNLTNYALNFCLNFQNVSAVIPGIKNTTQLNQYITKHDKKQYHSFNQLVFNNTEPCYPKWA